MPDSKPSIGKVAVLGSGGLLGSAIVQLLLQGHGNPVSITGFDQNEPRTASISFIRGDVREYGDVARAVEGCDTVINTVSVVNFNPKNDAWMESINVGGAANVLQACEDLGIPRLVHTSSMDVVYEGDAISGGDESLPYAVKFLDHYSYTKRVAEEQVLTAQGNVARCALRATGIYGPGDHIRFPSIVKAVKEGKYASIGGSDSVYSHVFSYNCAYAHILAGCLLAKGNALDRSAYFITDGSTGNFHGFVAKVLSASGLEVPKRRLPVGLAYLVAALSEFWIKLPWVPKTSAPTITKLGVSSISKDLWFTGEKARRELGYEPLYPLDTCIEMTASWIREHYC